MTGSVKNVSTSILFYAIREIQDRTIAPRAITRKEN
jgi:hypothetical protein